MAAAIGTAEEIRATLEFARTMADPKGIEKGASHSCAITRRGTGHQLFQVPAAMPWSESTTSSA